MDATDEVIERASQLIRKEEEKNQSEKNGKSPSLKHQRDKRENSKRNMYQQK